MGIIAGGMVDGTVQLFDPYEMMQEMNGNDSKAIIAIIPGSALMSPGVVTAMKFSPLSTHQLCIGTATGRVVIVDCTNPIHPICTEPGSQITNATVTAMTTVPGIQLPPPPQSHSGGGVITAVAWNTAVPHIVASASSDGIVTVWDVQSNSVWCEIRATEGGGGSTTISDIAWNPSEGLHLLIASGDDRNPVIRLWDLGTSTTVPFGTLMGHTAGIFHAAYCPHDDSLLVSVAKDNRTFLWDLRTLQPVAELPMDVVMPETMSSVHQNPSSATTTHHHHPTANALFASGRPGLMEQKQMRYDIQWSPHQRGVALICSFDKKIQIHTLLSLATNTGRPPAWMIRKSTVTTGFGGLLVSCCTRNAPTMITIQTIPEEPTLANTVATFESSLVQYQTSNNMIAFCQLMQQKCSSVEDTALWGFMQIMFETNARQEMLRHLGFVPEDIVASVQQYALTPSSGDLTNGISSMSMHDKVTTTATTTAPMMNATIQDLVKKALVVGNFDAAVDCCFETGNYADALMLAACGGGDLWSTTQQRYFDREIPKRPFLAIVSGIVHNQLEDVVTQSDLTVWQETLAILSTYSKSEEFPTLCILLGDRLQESGDESSASLCYMCALNLERSVLYWMKQMTNKTTMNASVTSDLMALHEFVEKVTVFVAAVGPSVGLTPEIESLYSNYSKALADQGLLVTATKYCHGASEMNKILRDRLYRSRASQQCFAVLGGVAPEFPYVMVDIQQSRGQVYVQPAVVVQCEPEVVSNGHHYHENQHSVTVEQHNYSTNAQSFGSNDVLAPGWVALQDPSSGNMYYANEATGETTWDMPKAYVEAPYSAPQIPIQNDIGFDASQRSQVMTQPTTVSKTKPSIVSKYGDGFVSSASNPELANQYGNVGTSNPYGGNARPGPAAVQSLQKAPVSGSLNIDKLQLSSHHASIRDTLLGAADALKQTNLNVVEKKQLDEAEKGIAILVKKLAGEALSDSIVDQVFALVNAISQHDFAASMAYQTALANSEWREHKDWLKGIKILIQLAIKKF
jgi:protein transport protein SEC31